MDQSCGQVTLLAQTACPKQFSFDGVYYMDATAEQIYNDIVYPLVEVSAHITAVISFAFLASETKIMAVLICDKSFECLNFILSFFFILLIQK
ncbi:unnamed protein product [Gongylonema pulchrum]|uniref:NPC1_N domain-containing protein n=1 Tax=Gongylonema pulchrum TaxID=637853 RepID=A0A183DFS3_9BILA|nr:unnamed protein product [Gongylonema pulchrum]